MIMIDAAQGSAPEPYSAPPDALRWLLETLGVQGVVVLIALAALTLKSQAVRRAEIAALRWCLRCAYRAVLAAVALARGFRYTREERRLLGRLASAHWREHAHLRGLGGTLTGKPKVTAAGIVVSVRLDGTWTAAKLKAAEPHVRALLGCRTGLRIEITAGKRGGWAQLTFRTRSAADSADLSGWSPGAPWGVDTVTGEPVMVPLGRRMLIAGTSGSGKSWSTRALLAEGSEAEDHRLVVIDPKRVEAVNWAHRARVAITRDEVLAVTDELVAEMHERLQLVPRGRDTVAISPVRPRITVFVDEGTQIVAMARVKGYGRVMENLSTLARMARAAEIILVWATQKPTMDAKGGIDPQISAQITYRAALALSTAGESRVVFGEDATERGWHAHDLPMPGYAMLRWGPKARPRPIRTRAFSPADVIGLPARPVWSRTAAVPAVEVPPMPSAPPAAPAPRVCLVKAPAGTAADLGELDVPEAVQRALQGAPADGLSAASLQVATGRGKSQVYAALSALVGDGTAVKAGRGRYVLATNDEEISA